MPHNRILRSVGLAVCLSLLQWLPAAVSTGHALLAVIRIDHADPHDISNAVSVLLSPDGKLSFDRRTRALVVSDTPQVVSQVRELVRRLDQPAPGLTIRVRMISRKSAREDELAVAGRVSGPGWSLSTGGRQEDGLDVTLEQSQTATRRLADIVLKSQSGRPAYIATGRDIPFTARWGTVCAKFGGCRYQTTYKRVETGFEVLPQVRGNYALVSITPRISSYEAGIVRFTTAVTQIRLPLGRWVDIGQVTGGRNEAFSAIIDSAAQAEETAVSLWMKITRQP
jgi:type II secretory pathway component HofQ